MSAKTTLRFPCKRALIPGFFTAFILCLFCFCSLTALHIYAAEEKTENPIKAPVFSVAPGFYEDEQTLTLTSPDGYDIFYTLDGSFPSKYNDKSIHYDGGISLKDVRTGKKVMRGTVVRAVCSNSTGQSSDCISCTYFIGKGVTTAYNVPVISLITDPDNLYNATTGIFTNPHESGREWERPMHFEFFDADGSLGVSINCGARVHGGASRDIENKSLRLYARAEYDTQKNFKYDFFSEGIIPAIDEKGKDITKFKHLLIRGGGNEATAWERTYYRDALIADTMRGTGLDIQAARAAIVFLNGKYYSIMNLRERQDERYIESHYGIDSEKVAIYSFWYNEKGEIQIESEIDNEDLKDIANAYYTEAFQFATTADMNNPDNYAKLCEYYDIDNYISYMCVELFSGNDDWPGNNCKAWCYLGEDTGKYGEDGKIRWLLFDTEFGLGLYGRKPYDDSFKNATAPNSTVWPNPKDSTLLFRNLLKCDTFKNAFVNRMMDLVNENFRSTALIKRSNELAEIYRPLIAENRNAGNQYADYNENVKYVNDYISKRATGVYMFLNNHLHLGTRYNLKIDFDPTVGYLQVGSIKATADSNCVNTSTFSGAYFASVPVTVTAVALPGYRFVGFEGDLVKATGEETHTGDTLLITNPADTNSLVLKAIFEPDETVFNTGSDEKITLNNTSDKSDDSKPNSGNNNSGSTGTGNTDYSLNSDSASFDPASDSNTGETVLIIVMIAAVILLVAGVVISKKLRKK